MLKKKYSYIYIILSGLLILIMSLFAIYYITNIGYYGKLDIVTNDKSKIEINGLSPLGNELDLHKTGNNYHYFYHRFYKKISVSADSLEDLYGIKVHLDKHEKYITIDSHHIRENDSKQYIAEIHFDSYNYPIHHKIADSFKHFFSRLYGLIIFALSFWVLLPVLFLFISNRLKIIKYVKNKVEKLVIQSPGYKYNIIICVFSVLLFFMLIWSSNEYSHFDNRVHINHQWDQYDYHTIAANFSLGYGFFMNGEISEETDYKLTEANCERVESEILYRSGYKTYRPPGFSLMASLIYKVFGINPIAIKIFNLLLLLSIVFLLPNLGLIIWNKVGYLAGLVAGPLFFVAFYKHASLVQPETFTAAINFVFVYLYILLRRKETKTLYVVTGIALGLGIMAKPSLAIILPLILIYIIYYSIKKLRKPDAYIKSTLFLISFLLVWLPYNIYANHIYKKLTDESSEFISSIKDKGLENTSINDFELLRNSVYKSPEITQNDVDFFLETLELEIDSLLYIPQKYYKRSNNFNNATAFLANIKIQTIYGKPFFMHPSIPIVYLLGFHNEYIDGSQVRYNNWIDDPDSYHNSVNNSSSFISNWAYFYVNNPEYILKNLYYKTKFAHSNLWIINIFIVIATLNLIISKAKKRFYKAIFVIATISSLVLNLAFILYPFILLFSFISNKERYRIPLIFALLILAFWAFSFFAFGDNRIASYYIFPIFLLTGLHIIYLLEKTNNLIEGTIKKETTCL